MEKFSRRETTAMLGSCGSSLLFGLSYMFSKRVLGTVSVFSLLSWRFLFGAAGMSLCVAFGLIKVNFRAKPLKPLLRMVFFMPGLYFIFEALGVRLTTASESGTIIACIPIFTLVASALLLREPPTRLQVGGILLSTAGILTIVLLKGTSASFSLPGYLFLLGAVCSSTLFYVESRRASGYTVFEKTYAMCLTGALVFTIGALAEHGLKGDVGTFLALPFTNHAFLASAAYLGLGCTTLAFLLSNRSIAILGTTRASAFSGLSTVISVISGVMILGDPFSWLQGAGTFLVLCGIYIVNIFSPLYDKKLARRSPDAGDESLVSTKE